MNIDITQIQPELDQYLTALSGEGEGNLIYQVSEYSARLKMEKLKQVLINIGNNPYMIGSYVCPWEGLGQELNEQGDGPLYTNLRMYDYKYSRKGVWHIVYIVDEAKENVCFTKLFGERYNTGKRLFFRSGSPIKEIKECLELMVKLGCFKQYQIESLRERGLL